MAIGKKKSSTKRCCLWCFVKFAKLVSKKWEFINKSICWTSLIVNRLVLLTAAEVEDPSSASSSLRFFLGPMAASAVELAARFRITSSSSCCSLWKWDKTHKITYSMKIDQSKLNFWELSTFIFTVKQLGNANKKKSKSWGCVDEPLPSHSLYRK